MWRSIAVLALLVAPLPAAAGVIDTALCVLDGVTQVPSFATGRDATQCLLVDPGNGDAPVKFQYEVFGKSGISRTAVDAGESPGVDIIDIYNCPDGKLCSFLMWNSVVDNYSTSASKNDDVLFFGTGQRNKYTLIKDSIIANGVKCDGGVGWTGPNGLRCGAGESSGAHSDGIQLRGQPVDDGWFVLQDTLFVNGYNLQLLVQGSSQYGRTGSFVMQGGEIGRRANVGAASNWAADCERRRDQGVSNGSDICPEGRATIGNDTREIWLIDVIGETPINANGSHQKIVVVNTGCNEAACNGTIGYRKGWPQPLYGWSSDGPGRCPNGSIGSYQGSPAYCYTSLERARNDHKLPPFVHLSRTGWASPPSTGTPTPTPPPSGRPAAPELMP